MRRFELINAKGESYTLTSRKTFLYSPSELGYNLNDSYAHIGNNFIPIDNRFAQTTVKGNVYLVGPGAYQKYYDFTRFLQATPLTLAYTPDIGTFYRDVIVSKIEKTELDKAGNLDIPIEFTALGLWYRITTEVNNGELTNGKIYDYEYPYIYGESAGVVRITSDSYEDSPAKLTIFGPVTNPTWKHYVNGEQVASGGMTLVVAEGRKLVIDATSNPYSIYTCNMNNESVTDSYQHSDFATERFIILQHGSNVVTVTGGPVIMLEGRVNYATV